MVNVLKDGQAKLAWPSAARSVVSAGVVKDLQDSRQSWYGGNATRSECSAGVVEELQDTQAYLVWRQSCLLIWLSRAGGRVLALEEATRALPSSGKSDDEQEICEPGRLGENPKDSRPECSCAKPLGRGLLFSLKFTILGCSTSRCSFGCGLCGTSVGCGLGGN